MLSLAGRETSDVVTSLADWLEAPADVPLLVETSGSTGAPKRVVLASAQAQALRLPGGRWLLALPPTYIAGAMVIVRSLLAGHRPSVLEPDQSLADAITASAAGDIDYVSLVPTQLRRALESRADTEALRGLRTLLLGGGPIDPSLRAAAEDAGLQVVATYGSAETCGGCVHDGLALPGCELDIAADGRLLVRGPMLFDRYDGDEALTAATLVDGWFQTSDLAELDPQGRLRILGRIDDMVISGGVNVATLAVAQRLRAHATVAEAEVIGVPDKEWGERVVAVVTAATDDKPQLDELRDWVAATLPRAWAPRQVILVDHLPMLPNGKPDRRALRELA